MNKPVFKKYLLCVTLTIANALLLYNDAFTVTAGEAFEKVKQRFVNVATMKGTVSITFDTGQAFTGEFQYMPPGKIFVNITDPPGKKIISNGKRLWIYDTSSDLCGVQELYSKDDERYKNLSDEEKKANEFRLKSGIESFFGSYETSALTEDPGGFTLELKNDKRFFTAVVIKLDKSYVLLSARFIDKTGAQFLIKLSNLKFNEKITPGIFNFNVPANATLVKNPMDIR